MKINDDTSVFMEHPNLNHLPNILNIEIDMQPASYQIG